MWGNKKPDAPSTAANPTSQQNLYSTPTSSIPATAVGEGTSMSSDAVRPIGNTPAGAVARLGASLHVKGEITGNEDLHIDGSVEGMIHLVERKLIVGAGAKLTADVVASEVVIYGSVKGNLRAKDRIEIKKDGSVIGDLTTARIMIEDGAYFKGAIEIDRSGTESESRDFAKPAFVRPAAPVTTATHAAKSAS
jgi:cytoskeletal protein CcmA (bactofilin family)